MEVDEKEKVLLRYNKLKLRYCNYFIEIQNLILLAFWKLFVSAHKHTTVPHGTLAHITFSIAKQVRVFFTPCQNENL
jgi:hypothetical protein